MATLADRNPDAPRATGITEFVDRWIYVFMAALFLVTVLVGFIPDSLNKIAAVEAGQSPPFPALLHVHAVLMGSWILLLLAQSTLMATNRRTLHMQLGVAGMLLAPAIIVVGFLLVPVMRLPLANAILNGPPEVAASLRPTFDFVINLILTQIRIGVMFALLVTIGLAARRRDSGLHKRLMILATAAPLPASLDRMTWLPHTLPASPLTIDLYPLVLIAPMFLWDLYRLRTVHRAYLYYLVLNLALAIPMNMLWGTQWWHDTGVRMLGITGL